MQANFKSHDHYYYTNKGWVKLNLNQKNTRQGRYGEFLGGEEESESGSSGISAVDCQCKTDRLIDLTRRMRRTRWAAREIRRVDLELGLTSMSETSQLHRKASVTTEISTVTEFEPWNNSPRNSSQISSDQVESEQSHEVDQPEATSNFTNRSEISNEPSSSGSPASRAEINQTKQPTENWNTVNEIEVSNIQSTGNKDSLMNHSFQAPSKSQNTDSDSTDITESGHLENPFYQEVTVGMIKAVHGLDRMDSAFADNLENLIITDKLPKKSSHMPEKSIIENPFHSDESLSLTREFAHSRHLKNVDGSENNVFKSINNSGREKSKKKKLKKEEKKLKKFMTNFRFYCEKEDGQLERVQQDAIDPSTLDAIPKYCSELMVSKGFTNILEKEPDVPEIKEDLLKEETNFEKCMREVAEAYKILEETEKSEKIIEPEKVKDSMEEVAKHSDQSILDPGSSEYISEEEEEHKLKPEKITLKQKLFNLLIKRIFDRSINVKGKQTTIRDVVGSAKEKEFMALKPLELELTRMTTSGDKQKNLSIDMTYNDTLVQGKDFKINIFEAPVFNAEESIEESLEKIISENWRAILQAAKRSIEKALKTKVKENEKGKCEKGRYLLKKKERAKQTITSMEKALDDLIDNILAEGNVNWDKEAPEAEQTDTLYVRAKGEQPAKKETMLDWPKNQKKNSRKAMITELTYKELREAFKTEEGDKKIHRRRTEKDFTFEGRVCEEEPVDAFLEEEKRSGDKEKCGRADRLTYMYPDNMAISKGPIKLMSGCRYNGMWNKVGLQSCCLYRTPGGIIIKCLTDDGIFSGDTTAYFPNGCTIQGKFINGEFKPAEYMFEDGLTYGGENWTYLKWPDRRFYSEIIEEKEPIGRQKTNTVPSRKVPAGCYDTGEGFYSPATKCIHHPHTLQPMRVAKPSEVEWIVNACRKGWDDCEPLTRRAHEYSYSGVFGKYPPPWPQFDSTRFSSVDQDKKHSDRGVGNETLDKWLQVNRKGPKAKTVVHQLVRHYAQYQPTASLKSTIKPPPTPKPRKHRSCKNFYRDLFAQIKHQDDFQLLSVYKKFI